MLAPLGNGVLVALDRAGKNLDGFPLGFSVGVRGTPMLGGRGGTADACNPILYAAGGDTLLYAISLFGDPGCTGANWDSYWFAEGGDAGRSYAPFSALETPVPAAGTPILEGSWKAYPNPARQRPITFAFQLREAGRVTISIYDAAARLVERIERETTAQDNAITWDPVGRPSGLYVARIEVPGQVATVPFALLR
jgi:hypothetical protein